MAKSKRRKKKAKAKTAKKKKSTRRRPSARAEAPTPPKKRSCACVQAYFGLLDRYPQFRFNQAKLETFTRTYMRAGRTAPRTGVVTIPTVVHVVHRTERENISDDQIESQIDVLNEDFRANNADFGKAPPAFASLAADAQIQFELARNGITRTRTDRTSFGIQDDVKSSSTGGIEPWDTSKYLNIWVCALTGGLLGYAQFPGGPPDTDGVVILNTAFGRTGTATAPFNRGRTATHEVGHFFNLSHIWGENRFPSCSDSDYVDDTPNQFAPNNGTPTFPSISCGNGPNGDMFMNYMDYVDDEAMFMFTQGQVARMRAALAGPRAQLGG